MRIIAQRLGFAAGVVALLLAVSLAFGTVVQNDAAAIIGGLTLFVASATAGIVGGVLARSRGQVATWTLLVGAVCGAGAFVLFVLLPGVVFNWGTLFLLLPAVLLAAAAVLAWTGGRPKTALTTTAHVG